METAQNHALKRKWGCVLLSGDGEEGGGNSETTPCSADRMKRNRRPGMETRWPASGKKRSGSLQ